MKAALVFFIFISSISAAGANNSSDEFESILNGWSQSYLSKIPANYTDTLNFMVNDDLSYWYVIFSDGDFTIHKGKNPDARIIFKAGMSTYRRIFAGELSPMTAVGRSSISEPAPLDFILENGMTVNKIDWDYIYYTVINFFNSNQNNKILLGPEYSRNVHGGNVVGLYYSVGFRSAWYNLKKGEILNEAGEKDPFEQSFIILKGTGFANIGNDTIVLKENEAYYIRPGLNHKVWTESEEGISLIWNAWGKKAW